jgi:hypothetical protein
MPKLKNGAKGGVFIVPSNSAIFWRFGSFVLHVILTFFGSFGSRIIICALRWGIYCPLQLGNFWGIVKSFGSRVIICALRWGIYCPLQLAPPTRRFVVVEIFGSFVSHVIFCALHFRVFIVPSILPLQLSELFWQFAKVFVLHVIICALRFCGVSCVLHAALAACVCCSILSISRMMCGVRNSMRMFW